MAEAQGQDVLPRPVLYQLQRMQLWLFFQPTARLVVKFSAFELSLRGYKDLLAFRRHRKGIVGFYPVDIDIFDRNLFGEGVRSDVISWLVHRFIFLTSQRAEGFHVPKDPCITIWPSAPHFPNPGWQHQHGVHSVISPLPVTREGTN